jgi:hypothetical protein
VHPAGFAREPSDLVSEENRRPMIETEYAL